MGCAELSAVGRTLSHSGWEAADEARQGGRIAHNETLSKQQHARSSARSSTGSGCSAGSQIEQFANDSISTRKRDRSVSALRCYDADVNRHFPPCHAYRIHIERARVDSSNSRSYHATSARVSPYVFSVTFVICCAVRLPALARECIHPALMAGQPSKFDGVALVLPSAPFELPRLLSLHRCGRTTPQASLCADRELTERAHRRQAQRSPLTAPSLLCCPLSPVHFSDDESRRAPVPPGHPARSAGAGGRREPQAATTQRRIVVAQPQPQSRGQSTRRRGPPLCSSGGGGEQSASPLSAESAAPDAQSAAARDGGERRRRPRRWQSGTRRPRRRRAQPRCIEHRRGAVHDAWFLCRRRRCRCC